MNIQINLQHLTNQDDLLMNSICYVSFKETRIGVLLPSQEWKKLKYCYLSNIRMQADLSILIVSKIIIHHKNENEIPIHAEKKTDVWPVWKWTHLYY